MFSYFIRKKLLNFIINEYEDQLYIYECELLKAFEAFDSFQNITEEELYTIVASATQEYYKNVFDTVCTKLSAKDFRFKSIMPLKFLSCDFDPDDLAAGHILSFAFSCMCNKEIEPKLCVYLNHYVANLKNTALNRLQKNI